MKKKQKAVWTDTSEQPRFLFLYPEKCKNPGRKSSDMR